MKKFIMVFLSAILLIFTSCKFNGDGFIKGTDYQYQKKANQIVNELISSIENKEENNIATVFATV